MDERRHPTGSAEARTRRNEVDETIGPGRLAQTVHKVGAVCHNAVFSRAVENRVREAWNEREPDRASIRSFVYMRTPP